MNLCKFSFHFFLQFVLYIFCQNKCSEIVHTIFVSFFSYSLFTPVHFFTFQWFYFWYFLLFFSRWFLGLLQIMSFKIEENWKSLHVMLANWDISGIYKSTKCTFYPMHMYVYVCVSLCVYGNCNTLCHHMFV